ncbi:MAG: hypothetical protein EOQ44_25315 [Mesorhizobium sp.]|uniref:hypothetical protein n=1 Tax=Mesorhizobium sp. TaxID=1871066 RepID=UPI000FE6554D|nr:hypothetical protein [Mesorhizobium sp.]RWB40461.1 MAG: hypothetical protein EOQ44_25315 [Mesorhizobium sp.]
MEAVLAILWKILKISIPVPLFAVLLVLAWWQLDKHSAVRRAVDKAVDSYTHVTELAAANATIAELKRQQRAAEDAATWLNHQVDALQKKQAADYAINEKKDITYAQAIKDAGRGCTLNDADIDSMRDE